MFYGPVLNKAVQQNSVDVVKILLADPKIDANIQSIISTIIFVFYEISKLIF